VKILPGLRDGTYHGHNCPRGQEGVTPNDREVEALKTWSY